MRKKRNDPNFRFMRGIMVLGLMVIVLVALIMLWSLQKG